MKNRLTREFKTAVDNIRNGTHDSGAFSALEARAKKDFAVTSKKKFMKELNQRLKLLAKELPSSVNNEEFSYLVTMPAKVHFNKGALSVWRGRRKAFNVTYQDLRDLEGMKQIIGMAHTADVALGVQLFSFDAAAPSRELAQVCEPTPAEAKPWTMKRDLGTFTELNVYLDSREKFEAEKFPKKLPKMKAP